MASQIIKQDGFGSMYKGLSAGLLRQVRIYVGAHVCTRCTFTFMRIYVCVSGAHLSLYTVRIYVCVSGAHLCFYQVHITFMRIYVCVSGAHLCLYTVRIYVCVCTCMYLRTYKWACVGGCERGFVLCGLLASLSTSAAQLPCFFK